MYVKIINDNVARYPYDIGTIRYDNPNISFPEDLSKLDLAAYGVYKVQQTSQPVYDSKTHRPISNVEKIDGVWTEVWQIIEQKLEQATGNVKNYRRNLLQETDWMALSDVTMPPEMAVYRQALRDITDQSGYPYGVIWPTKPA